MTGVVMALSRSQTHTFNKASVNQITLLAGLGVKGDAHMGETVKHRSRVKVDPTQPNLRQVYLLHAELLDELTAAGFVVSAGNIGENVTTRGLDLLSLPRGTILHLGETAQVEVTGLRNPCRQLNTFQPGLLEAVLDTDADGHLVRKAGIMGIVLTGGDVKLNDPIRIELPALPHHKLECV
jgi:MOSC domain-containing protein YiiM